MAYLVLRRYHRPRLQTALAHLNSMNTHHSLCRLCFQCANGPFIELCTLVSLWGIPWLLPMMSFMWCLCSLYRSLLIHSEFAKFRVCSVLVVKGRYPRLSTWRWEYRVCTSIRVCTCTYHHLCLLPFTDATTLSHISTVKLVCIANRALRLL